MEKFHGNCNCKVPLNGMCSRIQENNKNKVETVMWDTLYNNINEQPVCCYNVTIPPIKASL